MCNKKWYNVEIPREKANVFKTWLNSINASFEPSEAGNMIHIEIYTSADNVGKINNALDELVWCANI